MDWLSQNWPWIVLAVAAVLLCRRGGHRGHGSRHDEERSDAPAPEAAIDPVSGNAVRTAEALTSVFEGRTYYFESPANRERFEALPQEYAQKAAGHPPSDQHSASHSRHRRGRGC